MHNCHNRGAEKNSKFKNDKIEGVVFILKKWLKTHMTHSKELFFQFPLLRSVSTHNLRLVQG